MGSKNNSKVAPLVARELVPITPEVGTKREKFEAEGEGDGDAVPDAPGLGAPTLIVLLQALSSEREKSRPRNKNEILIFTAFIGLHTPGKPVLAFRSYLQSS